MDKQIEIGLVKGINKKRGKLRYNVQLPNGRMIVVNKRLILQHTPSRLAIDTQLIVEHKADNVIRAKVKAAPQKTTKSFSPSPIPAAPTRQQEHKRASIVPTAVPPYQSRSTTPPVQKPPISPAARTKTARPQHTDKTRTDEETAPERTLDTSIACPAMEPIFAQTGPVAALLGSRYRPRQGQVQMANLIRQTLQEQQHAFIEAGTGIGKSFAYLIPPIWASTQAIVSTSNKALMEQLWTIDIPRLQKVAPQHFSAALLKGRSNYICRQRWEKLCTQSQLPGFADRVDLVKQKLLDIPSGDCEQMRLPPHIRNELVATYRTCEWKKCPQFDGCFYERAKEWAREADIVVTNHALLCFNMLASGNKILPVRPILIVDEAHELERYAINALTRQLEYNSLFPIVNHSITCEYTNDDERRKTMECNQAFFDAVHRMRPHKKGKEPPMSWTLNGEIQEGIALMSALQNICRKLELGAAKYQGNGLFDSLLRQAKDTTNTAQVLGYQEPKDKIRYCELQGSVPQFSYKTCLVKHSPLDVSKLLERALFKAWPRVVCTSATLGINRNLQWYKQRVGAPLNGQTQNALIDSPFDYARNAVVYVPQGLVPQYNEHEEEYVQQLIEVIQCLVESSRGRAFLLFTSRRRMTQLYQTLSPIWNEYTCFCQGEGLSRMAMIEQFKAADRAVLFGTRSFWEGVDIPGEALSLVAIDKIPFQPMQDPVVAKKIRLFNSRGENSFEAVQLGPAILALRQGVGRLIRSETDRGVMAILDSRAVDHPFYGRKIQASLPPARRTRNLKDIESFFAGSSIK